jgi:radical SAM superfamily enzyme YgiQ (UPF0313 family)
VDILLVNAPIKDITSHASASPPLGLAYIASVLLKDGYDVSTIDFNVSGLDNHALEGLLEQKRPYILGISAHTETYLSGLIIAGIAKRMHPGITTVMGGTHPTVMYEEVAKERNIDIVVRGEGELTILELAACLIRNKGSLPQIKGIAYRKDGVLRTTPERPFIVDIDQLPFPARELFPTHGYGFPARVLGSRGGCPFNCPFCAVNNIWKGARRFRSPENVAEEVLYIFENLKTREINFADDTFTLNREHVMRLCGLSKKIRQAFPWSWTCATRVDLVDRELLEKMYESGCHYITFGVEAGSQEILDSIGKKITLDQVRKAVSAALDIGMGVNCSFMFPHPKDTRETICEQKKFMKELSHMEAGISLAFTTPYPGTYYYEHANELGIKILAGNWDEYDGRHLVIATEYLSEERLNALYQEMYYDLGMQKA